MVPIGYQGDELISSWGTGGGTLIYDALSEVSISRETDALIAAVVDFYPSAVIVVNADRTRSAEHDTDLYAKAMEMRIEA